MPPSEADAKQIVATLAATRSGGAAALHIRDVACLALDIPAALKADAEVNVWSDAMPGLLHLQIKCFKIQRLTGSQSWSRLLVPNIWPAAVTLRCIGCQSCASRWPTCSTRLA